MYGLYGISENIKNVYRLSAPFANEDDLETIADLKPAYFEFLKHHQPAYPLDLDADQIVSERGRAQTLATSFAASKINDLHQEKMIGDFYDQDTQATCFNLARRGLDALADANAEAIELFNLVVHSILLCGSNLNNAGMRAHGGTSSKCVGLMWLSMQRDLSTQDLVELFIHEMTHTLVFLDELNHGHFDYTYMTLDENWAQSSILNRQRPMDKVIHSIVVAHEVLSARATFLSNTDKLNVHPSSKTLKANTLDSIASVLNHPRRDLVCKPRAIELAETVRVQLLNM